MTGLRFAFDALPYDLFVKSQVVHSSPSDDV